MGTLTSIQYQHFKKLVYLGVMKNWRKHDFTQHYRSPLTQNTRAV